MTSIFSFSYNIFKGLFLQGCQKLSLCGKGSKGSCGLGKTPVDRNFKEAMIDLHNANHHRTTKRSPVLVLTLACSWLVFSENSS